MNKKLVALGAIVVVGLGYVGATAYVGSKTETTIRAQVAEMNAKLAKELYTESTGNYAKLRVLSFERNVFKSEAVYQLDLSIAEELTHRLQFKDEYYHGPWPVAAMKAGKFAPVLSYAHTELVKTADSEVWFEAAKGQVPFTAETLYRFRGGASTEMEFAPITLSESDLLIDMAKATVQLDIGRNLANHSASALIPSLAIRSPHDQGGVVLKDIRFNGHSVEKTDRVTNQYDTLIKHVEVDSGIGALVTLADLSVVSQAIQKDKLIDASLNYHIAEVSVDKHSLGSFELNTQAKNLDYAVLKEMNALMSQSDEEVEAAIEPLVHQLLAKKPELSVSPFLWRNSGGDARIEFSTQLRPTEQQGTKLENVVERLDVNVSLSRDMVLAILGEEAGFLSTMVAMIFDGKVKELSDQGLIRYADNIAHLDLKYDGDSQLFKVNGRTLTLQELSAMVGTQMGSIMDW